MKALVRLYAPPSIVVIERGKPREIAAPFKEMKRMTTGAFANIAGRALSTQEKDPLSQRKRWWSAAFLVSATLGSIAGVSGIGINALFLFRIAENKGAIGLVGIWLLVIAFPLLFFSAHCLDKVDSVERAIRKQGLSDEDL